MLGFELKSLAISPVSASASGGNCAEFSANATRWLTKVCVLCPALSLSCVLVASICAQPVMGGAGLARAAASGSKAGSESAILVERPGVARAEFYAMVECDDMHPVGSVRRMRFIAANGRNLVGVPVP